LEIKGINKIAIFETIKNGEFGKEIIDSRKNTAVIMTQDWCHQWKMMNGWIGTLSDDIELDIYLIIYNKEDYYEEFMSFKEEVFGNYEIPYIRYYVDGVLVQESNYVPKDSFLNFFNRAIYLN
jgi:hypothetical protein